MLVKDNAEKIYRRLYDIQIFLRAVIRRKRKYSMWVMANVALKFGEQQIATVTKKNGLKM